jgi:hypothetical protein
MSQFFPPRTPEESTKGQIVGSKSWEFLLVETFGHMCLFQVLRLECIQYAASTVFRPPMDRGSG